MEFLPIKSTALATSFTLGIDGLGIAVASLWFLYISKDWKTFFLMTTIVCYIATAFIYITMTESPKFLVSRGRYEEARTVITKMYVFNKRTGYSFSESEKGVLGGQCMDGKYRCKW